jgi:hypothetical protein
MLGSFVGAMFSTPLRGFTLTASQRADLIAFLRALTDEAVLRDPRFADPWIGEH